MRLATSNFMNFIKRFFIVLASVLLLSSCLSLRDQTQLDWPEGLPAITYYISSYEQDPINKQYVSLSEYLLWVKRLYLGWQLYRSGWLELSNDLAETIVDSPNKDIAKEKLALIGRVVSPEWAKHRKLSTIKTRHLIIWGNALYQSPANDEQLEVIDKVLADAKLLIGRQLSPKQILADRYYPQAALLYTEDPFQ
jgi:hypothetical protein